MEALTLKAQPRTITGKKVRQLRRRGITPIHIYGPGLQPIAAQVETSALRRLLAQAGRSTPVTVEVDGSSHFAFVREVQRHPVTGQILHVDFLQVDVSRRMQGQVPLTLVGEAPAVREQGAVLSLHLPAVTVECLPRDMPAEIQVDVSSLREMGDSLHVRDLSPPPGVTLLEDPDALVVRASPPRQEEVPAEAPAEEEAPGEGEG